MANLRSGFGEVQKAVEKSKQGFIPPTGKLNYFGLEKDEIMIVRFLDDFPITTKIYEWVMNNQGKATSEFICAPDLYKYDTEWQGRDWVQDYVAPAPGIGWQKKYRSEEMVPAKPTEKTIGIAVKREIDPETKQVRDALEEITDGDEQHVALHFMIVKQALSNFWDQMVGYHGLYGTICDRDYRIQRTGDGNKTKYQAIGLNPDSGWEYGDPANGVPSPSLLQMQAYYGYGVKLAQDRDTKDVTVVLPPDLDEVGKAAYEASTYSWDNRYLYCGTTVGEWAERRASQEYIQYWLDPKAEHLTNLAAKGAVTAESLQATRPADPRGAAPAVAPPPPVTQPAAPPQNLDGAAAQVPAAPTGGDRFEQMRNEMAARQQAAATK